MLEQWMRSYQPEELFDANGRLMAEIAALAPKGDRRMGANPHANGGLLLKDLVLPDFRDYAVDVPAPGAVEAEATRVTGQFLRDVMRLNAETRNFRVMGPDETASNRLGCVVRSDQPDVDRAHPAHRRPCRAGRSRDGGAERASVPGLARRLSADRAPRLLLVLRSVHPHHRLDVQSARQVAEGDTRNPLASADRLAELPADQPCLAAGPQRFQPSGSRASSTTW